MEFTYIGFGFIDLALNNHKELKINKEIPDISVYLATNKDITLPFSSKAFIKYLENKK